MKYKIIGWCIGMVVGCIIVLTTTKLLSLEPIVSALLDILIGMVCGAVGIIAGDLRDD